jgi:MYXO-CTERM domain-containing protein
MSRTMRHLMRCLVAAGAATLALAGAQAATPASTPPAEPWVYTFEGHCFDCAEAAGQERFPVQAELVLSGFGADGLALIDHLVSFSYGGSNLVDPYVVLGPAASPELQAGEPQAYQAFDFQALFADARNQSVSIYFGPQQMYFDLEVVDGEASWATCAPLGGVLSTGTCQIAQVRQDNDFGFEGQFSLVAAPVPEPGAAVLGMAGLLVLLARRRRRD